VARALVSFTKFVELEGEENVDRNKELLSIFSSPAMGIVPTVSGLGHQKFRVRLQAAASDFCLFTGSRLVQGRAKFAM
jgi:hypothetical protein